MSYTNGIGSPQQAFDATEAAASASTNRTAKTGQSSAPESGSVQAGSNHATQVDQAKLSTTGGVLAQALSGSDVRTEKVTALQLAIGTGTYNVSSSDVADKVMSALLR